MKPKPVVIFNNEKEGEMISYIPNPYYYDPNKDKLVFQYPEIIERKIITTSK